MGGGGSGLESGLAEWVIDAARGTMRKWPGFGVARAVF